MSNKLSLNTSKTEIVLFKPSKNKITKHRNFSSQVKYLGVIMQDDLNCDTHLTNLEK